MSDETAHTPLAAVEALEAGTFRLGQVLRRLLAAHPELTFRSVRPSVYVSAYHDEAPSSSLRVDLSARDVDGVRAWAKALDAEVKTRINADTYLFELVELQVDIDGVELSLAATRRLPEDEAAARQAEQDQAAAEGAEGDA